MQGIATLGYQPLTCIQASPAMYNAAKILEDMGREEDTYGSQSKNGRNGLCSAT